MRREVACTVCRDRAVAGHRVVEGQHGGSCEAPQTVPSLSSPTALRSRVATRNCSCCVRVRVVASLPLQFLVGPTVGIVSRGVPPTRVLWRRRDRRGSCAGGLFGMHSRGGWTRLSAPPRQKHASPLARLSQPCHTPPRREGTTPRRGWVDRGASAATGRRRRAEGRRRPAALTPTVSVVASRCMFLKSFRPSAPLRTDLPHRGRYRWRTDHECGRASLQPCRPAMGLASVPRDGRGRQ